MKVVVILNGVSRKKKLFLSRFHDPLSNRFQADVWETQYAGHAEQLASAAVEQGYDVLLSAGGDGTMHQVVNGVMAGDKIALTRIGLIPLGSGNDLARSLDVSTNAESLISQIEGGASKEIDIGLVHARDSNGRPVTRYFVNECSMGMGPEVVRRVNNGAGRGLVASLMYTKAILGTFLSLKPDAIEVNADGLSWSGKSRVMAVANGRSFGHGIYIAPNAKMNDGMLNLFVASNPPLVRFLMLLQQLKRPAKSTDDCLTYKELRSVVVRGDKPLPVEADGELVGFSPLKCEVASRKIRILA